MKMKANKTAVARQVYMRTRAGVLPTSRFLLQTWVSALTAEPMDAHIQGGGAFLSPKHKPLFLHKLINEIMHCIIIL